MNKSKLIGGVICLVIAAVLTIVNLTLPEENVMFMLGDVNMPWIPPIVLTIVGIVLLATVNQSEEKKENVKMETTIDPENAALNKRLETAFFGLFLIMAGGQWLLHDANVPNGTWDVGVGLILLGLNAARYFSGLRMSGFTTFLGILAFVGGLAQMIFNFDFGGALLLIVLGAYLILKPWFDKQGLFGKAESN